MFNSFANWLTFTVLNLTPDSHIAESFRFFAYDSAKILFLLIVITHIMSFVRIALPMEKIRVVLTSKNLYGCDYLISSIFGAITPFCSCSSIPLFIGFTQSGIHAGLTFTYLITSPLINEVAVVLFLGIFGWKITLMYVTAGMLIGMIGGYVVGKFANDKDIQLPIEEKIPCGCKKNNQKTINPFRYASREAFSIMRRVTLFVLIGVAIGSAIHGYVPEGYFEKYLNTENIFAVPMAVIIAVPLYANASGVIPIIESLVAKGVALGTALSFMMAIVGLSLPEALILKRVMSMRLLLIFFGVVTAGIIVIGYIFNAIL